MCYYREMPSVPIMMPNIARVVNNLQLFFFNFNRVGLDQSSLIFRLLFEWRVDGRWRNHCNTYLTLPLPSLARSPRRRDVRSLPRAPSVAQLTQNSPKGETADRSRSGFTRASSATVAVNCLVHPPRSLVIHAYPRCLYFHFTC